MPQRPKNLFRDMCSFRKMLFPDLVGKIIFPAWMLSSPAIAAALLYPLVPYFGGEGGWRSPQWGLLLVGCWLLLSVLLILAGRIVAELGIALFDIRRRLGDIRQLLLDIDADEDEE